MEPVLYEFSEGQGLNQENGSDERNLEIERLRAIAVIWVILHHCPVFWPFVSRLYSQAWTGVDLFFVISGFVVAKSFDPKLPPMESESSRSLVEKLKFYMPQLKVFWGRRIFRIFPLALAWMIIPWILWWLFPEAEPLAPNEKGYAKEILSFLSLQINYANLHEPSKFVAYWSLAVEEHFYLLLPFLFFLTRNRSKQLLISLLGICFVVFVSRPYLTKSSDLAQSIYFLHSDSLNRFDSLLSGVLVYILVTSGVLKGERPFLISKSLIIRSLICYLALYFLWVIPFFYKNEYLFRYGFPIFWALSCYLVYCAQFSRGLVANFFIFNPVFHWIGKRSYGFYIIHQPAQWIFFSNAKSIKSWNYFFPFVSENAFKLFVYLTLLVLLVELSWWLIEKPGIAFSKRVFSYTTSAQTSD